MMSLLAPVLRMLSSRRPTRGASETTRPPRRLRPWVVAAATVAAMPTLARGEASPAPASAVAAVQTRCEPLPPFLDGKDALTAAARALVARGKTFRIGSPEHTDIKIEVMTLFARAGDLEMCKLLRKTQKTPALSQLQSRAIACVQQQFCQPMPLPSGCPAGLRNEGPEGCSPIRSCTAAGSDAQATACEAGEASCCAPALLMLEIADAQAGMPTPESLAARRTLARIGCDAGHAELCLEASALGVGAEVAQRERACALGHVESCRSLAPKP
ncbi:hypothetical protein OV090_33995 [Nannocystis sp. RBIL2]|uniref:hypothetical protein n=1 Tax=Nannocystis sp. RBIL2 TaxID=2996788 RepID=UPI0022708854|nr:hypothetical protein [Nannocystis sp. RBIL2]MCY1069803.1 hypothetical protein [Nannocystis sp. RBIL2]